MTSSSNKSKDLFAEEDIRVFMLRCLTA